MKIKRPRTLAEFRKSGRCELCGEYCKHREPHHLRGRHPQIDLRINLIGLGRSGVYACSCHHDLHYSGQRRRDCEAAVAKREGCSEADLESVMDLIWRADKAATRGWFLLQSAEWSDAANLLLVRTLDEAGIK